MEHVIPVHVMHTISGRLIDFENPNSDNIIIEDIAWHLARINRFNGATSYPYSVASHCVMVSRRMHAGLEKVGLLHDAAEAYINDLSSGLKGLCPDYRDIERRFWKVIAAKFGLPEEIHAEVKEIDQKMACWEAQILQPWPPAWAQREQLPDGFGLPCYNEYFAEQAFLARFNELYNPHLFDPVQYSPSPFYVMEA
jgi:hypothetical protein